MDPPPVKRCGPRGHGGGVRVCVGGGGALDLRGGGQEAAQRGSALLRALEVPPRGAARCEGRRRGASISVWREILA